MRHLCRDRFYARLTELRNRIRAGSMPLLPADGEEDATGKDASAESVAESPAAFRRPKPVLEQSLSIPANFSTLPRSLAGSNRRHGMPPLPELADRRRAVSTTATPVITDLLSPSPTSSLSSTSSSTSTASSASRPPTNLELWYDDDDTAEANLDSLDVMERRGLKKTHLLSP
jgi:hypothetical protein